MGRGNKSNVCFFVFFLQMSGFGLGKSIKGLGFYFPPGCEASSARGANPCCSGLQKEINTINMKLGQLEPSTERTLSDDFSWLSWLLLCCVWHWCIGDLCIGCILVAAISVDEFQIGVLGGLEDWRTGG